MFICNLYQSPAKPPGMQALGVGSVLVVGLCPSVPARGPGGGENLQHGITSSSCSAGEVQTLSPSQEYFLTNLCPRKHGRGERVTTAGKHFQNPSSAWSTGMIPFLGPGEHLVGREGHRTPPASTPSASTCPCPCPSNSHSQTQRVSWKMLLLSDE